MGGKQCSGGGQGAVLWNFLFKAPGVGESGAQQIVSQWERIGFSSAHNTQGAQDGVEMEASVPYVEIYKHYN